MSKDRNVTKWISKKRSIFPADEKISTRPAAFLDTNLTKNDDQRYNDPRSIEYVTPSVVKRLVVLVPDQEVDELKISRKILSQALSRRLDIVLVTLVQDSENEFVARRRLATMMTLLRGPLLKVETKVALGRSWLKLVGQLYKYGDMIYCPAELMTLSWMGMRKPLRDVLKKVLNIPVVSYSGFFHESYFNWPNYFRHALYWIILIAIFILFFLFEIDLNLSVIGWPGQVVACIIIIIEVGVIYYWTSIAG